MGVNINDSHNMTYQSKTEINFNRLLYSMEEMVSNKQTNNWRFEKYLSAARSMLLELSAAAAGDSNKQGATVSSEQLRHYITKVEFLNQILESSRASSLEERVRLVNSLSSTSNGTASTGHSLSTPSGKDGVELASRNKEKDKTPELIAKEKGALLSDLRSELFSSSRGEYEGQTLISEEDNEARLRRQRNLQADITEDMLGLVRHLKDISKSAGQVVRDDMKVIDKSGRLLDSNMSRLKTETGRLDSHLQSACNWTIWVMIGVVIVFFIGMVLFMRFFSKS